MPPLMAYTVTDLHQNPKSYTLNPKPTLYTLNPTPYTLHPTIPKPKLLNPSPQQ